MSEQKEVHYCMCGCGTELRGKKALFAPGHDMKAKSAIINNIKKGEDLFDGISDEVKAYAQEKWVHDITKSIGANGPKVATKGQKFETDEAKKAAIDSVIENYTDQLAA